MKAKIEKDCMVMVQKSFDENNGKFATAIRYIGPHSDFLENDLWILSKDMMCLDGNSRKHYHPYMPERCLLRIDGHEENNHLTETEMKGVYV